MNKQLFSFFTILIALIIGAIYYNSAIQQPFISTLNFIKIQYHNGIELINNSIDKHLFQAQKIATLQKNLQNYESTHLTMQQLISEINDLYQENNSSLKTDPRVELIRAISYERFGDTKRIWMEVPEYNASKIYGFTYKDLVAGIIISQHKRALGLLNTDSQSAYGVFIGANQAPGIAHGDNMHHIIVRYIPAWYTIKKGDEVITSGLDSIFFRGLKVGHVLSVTKSQGYQNAVVEPYYKANKPDYFHMIRSVR